MADCTCADPQSVTQAVNGVANATSTGSNQLDETLYGKTLQGGSAASGVTVDTDATGKHGAIGAIRFCHWAAPEYGGQGESLWNDVWQAAQLAIALLGATIQGEIADKMEDLAEGYYDQAKYKWDRFSEKYKPLEEALLKEVSTVDEPEMDCDDDRSRAESAVNLSYDYIDQYIGRMSKALRLCLDDTIVSQLNYGRTLMLVDTENYNIQDDVYFTDYKSDQRWGRRSNVLNLGRNMTSMALQYGDIARGLLENVSGFVGKATSAIGNQFGYYGTRFDTWYPSTYLGTAGTGSSGLVTTSVSATNSAKGGF